MTETLSNVFTRRLDRILPVAVEAKGVWIKDSNGRRYLDGSGGALVVNVGHGREEIGRAMLEQAVKCYYVHGTMFTTPVVEKLAKALAYHSPPSIERFYFLSSGSEAIEASIKMARQIHLDSDRPQRIRLISRWKSYHGLSLGALSAMGRTSFRTPFAPLLSEVIHIPPPYCLRCSYGLSYPNCGIKCALELEETIKNAGPDIVSAFLAETVSGGTLAVYPPPPEYFPIIRQICDQYNVLLILDEIMCGLGRTGQWFASQHYNVIPDIVALGKGLSGGVASISAVGVQSKYIDIIRNRSKNFIHGSTYSHHAVSAAAALAVIGIIDREDLVNRVDSQGKILGERLKQRLTNLPYVVDVRGLGYMWGLELAKNKETLSPYPRNAQIAEKVWEALFRKGIITYPSTGLAGIDGDAIIVAPPYIIEEDEINLLIESIGQALEGTLGK